MSKRYVGRNITVEALRWDGKYETLAYAKAWVRPLKADKDSSGNLVVGDVVVPECDWLIMYGGIPRHCSEWVFNAAFEYEPNTLPLMPSRG